MAEHLEDLARLTNVHDHTFRAPDMVGHVEGWRAWDVPLEPPPFGTVPKLRSVTHTEYFWAPRRFSRAECRNCQDVPGETCSCGFYCAKTLEHLRTMSYHHYDASTGTICVVGKVACWGKVIEGSQGWRAEKAYPVALYVPFEGHRLVKPLRDAYGVPVTLMNILDPTSTPKL